MKKWIAVLMTAVMLALTGSFAVMAEDETEGENGGTVTVTAPVSYTHLDVYKRQA